MILRLLPGIGVLLLACVVLGVAVESFMDGEHAYGLGAACLGGMVVLAYLGISLLPH